MPGARGQDNKYQRAWDINHCKGKDVGGCSELTFTAPPEFILPIVINSKCDKTYAWCHLFSKMYLNLSGILTLTQMSFFPNEMVSVPKLVATTDPIPSGQTKKN